MPTFESFVDPELVAAGSTAGRSRKRTRSQTKKAEQQPAREPLARKANGCVQRSSQENARQQVAAPTRKRQTRGSGGSNQDEEEPTKRARVTRASKASAAESEKTVAKKSSKPRSSRAEPARENKKTDQTQRRNAAIADLESFVAQNPGALCDEYADEASAILPTASSAVALDYEPSKAALFFQSACEDIIERISAAVELEECPKVMLVNTAWAAKLRPRIVEYAPSRRILHNLMKRQVIVDPGFLHDIMQDNGNSAGLTLRMHMILIDWLVDVAVEFHLGDATLALTAQIIGRFLSTETVEKRELQLLGVTAMWIASKMEEVSVPLVSDFAWITYDTYTPSELRFMERRILRALRFRLSCVTPWTLVHTVLELPALSRNVDMKHVTGFLHDLAIHDPAFSTEAPGEVAAAIVYAALRAVFPAEAATKLEHSGQLEYLLKCQRSGSKALLEAIVQLPQKARQMEHKLSAVLVKFRKEENGNVADRIFPSPAVEENV